MSLFRRLFVFSSYLLFSGPMLAQANPPATKTVNAPDTTGQASLTKSQGDAILEELRQIRILLQQQADAAKPAPAEPVSAAVKMPVRGGWYAMGKNDAPVTVVEFTDYQCPFCRGFEEDSFQQLKRAYIDTGKVRFIVRDMPLGFHTNAIQAATAARCAGEQGKFWEMHDAMMHDKLNDLRRTALVHFAEDAKLKVPAFSSCLDSDKYKEALATDIADADGFGITGTPSFVVGKTGAQQIDGVRIEGAVPFPVFEAAIKKDLDSN